MHNTEPGDEKVIDSTEEFNRFRECFIFKSVAHPRISILLQIQLFTYFSSGGLNPFKVMKEIEVLETASGESRTKPATKFNGPFLKGLFHKHHMEDGVPSLSQNLLNALKTYGLPDFERLSIEAEKEGRVVSLDDINAIVNEAVSINYQRRANDQQLTGEWIIFAQHEGENYYLCLGKHGQDEKIRSEIDALCVLEFPFLNEILPQIEGGIH